MNNKIENKKTTVSISKDILEKIKADFIDEDYIRESPYTIYRIDKYSNRYYLKVEDDRHIIGAGVTSILSSEMPTSRYLISWQRDMAAKYNIDYVKWLLEQSANYGTFLHVVFGMLLRKMTLKFDIDSLLAQMESFFVKQKYDFNECMKWYKKEKRNIQKDILCFVQWTKDYKIIPLAIEFPFVVETEIGNYAGTIDLVCKATFVARGKEVTKIIIVDFKSGEKFYDSHEIQLYGYQQAWNIEYPELQAEEIWNFSPKNFRMRHGKNIIPTYNFKNQTKTEVGKRWPKYLELFYMDEANKHIEKKVDFGNEEMNLETEIEFIEYDPINDIIEGEEF